MREDRTCPVCENKIPDDARFLCPNCRSELNWLDDEGYIEKRKITLERIKHGIPTLAVPEKLFVSKFGFFLSGIIGVIIFSVVVELTVGHYFSISAFGLCLPLGLLAGYISYRLTKETKFFSNRVTWWFLPIILSVILSVIFWNLF